MSFFMLLLLFLSFLCEGFSSTNNENLNIMDLILQAPECSLLNKNFISVLNLDSLCLQPILNAEKYQKTLNYPLPLLCFEFYYSVSSRFCNLKLQMSELKSAPLPTDVNDVKKFLDDLRSNFTCVDQFCDYAGKSVKTISVEKQDFVAIDTIFTDVMKNKTSCKVFCKDGYNNYSSDLCNIIVWARTVGDDEQTSVKDRTTTVEDHIQKIDPKQVINIDGAGVDHENSELVLNKSPKPLNKAPDKKNLLTPIETNPKSPDSIKETNDSSMKIQSKVDNYSKPEKAKIPASNDGYLKNIHIGQNSPIVPDLIKVNDDVKSLPSLKKEPQQNPKENENFLKENTDIENINNSDKDFLGTQISDNVNNKNDEEILPAEQENDENYLPNQKVESELQEGNEPKKEEEIIDRESVPFGHFQNEHLEDAEDSHFFAYCISMGIVCVIMYVLFHNKKKILALAVEGRRGRPHGGGRRRPNTAAYSKLDSNLEEAMVSNVSQATVTHVLY